MKAEVKKKEVAFEPIELVITIWSLNDLKTLYNIFNVSGQMVSDRSKQNGNYKIDVKEVVDFYDVWDEINETLKNLRK